MLSEKIGVLYKLLQCNNTDIARYAGCSPGNISRLKTGNRAPGPESRSIRVFAEGVYGYADYENMLPVLQELSGASDASRETLIPAVIAWLFDAETAIPLPQRTVPKSRQEKEQLLQSFGANLDSAMTLLELSNGQLASILNIDPSLVSRYRSGINSPHRNPHLSEKLSMLLVNRAQKNNQTAALAELCSVPEEELDADAVAAWLYRIVPAEDTTAMAQLFLRSLDDFMPGQRPSSAISEAPAGSLHSGAEKLPAGFLHSETEKLPAGFLYSGTDGLPPEPLYYGMDGLRRAVIRFLSDAAREGGELLLYSDEPLDWMVRDPEFFAIWKSLMLQCVVHGVKIRIIHNVNRDIGEMIEAIRGWFPLYMSGMIEPYVFRRDRNPRFYHTIFLRRGSACIHGFFPTESGDDRWYDYITGEKRLEMLSREYDAMLSTSAPFLKVYTCAAGDTYRTRFIKALSPRKSLLSEYPVCTMPESLLMRILARMQIAEDQKASLLSLYRRLHEQFGELLRREPVELILCPENGAREGSKKVNFGLDLIDLPVCYTPEEYAEHLAAIRELVKTEKNFHLTLLTASPFSDIQIALSGDSVAVLSSREPYAAFVFTNAALSESISEYLSMLTKNSTADRHAVLEMLQ